MWRFVRPARDVSSGSLSQPLLTAHCSGAAAARRQERNAPLHRIPSVISIQAAQLDEVFLASDGRRTASSVVQRLRRRTSFGGGGGGGSRMNERPSVSGLAKASARRLWASRLLTRDVSARVSQLVSRLWAQACARDVEAHFPSWKLRRLGATRRSAVRRSWNWPAGAACGLHLAWTRHGTAGSIWSHRRVAPLASDALIRRHQLPASRVWPLGVSFLPHVHSGVGRSGSATGLSGVPAVGD